MEDVKLVERKPSERLIDLVDAIPRLKINGNRVVYCGDKTGTIYNSSNGEIHWSENSIYYNPLKNKDKLKESRHKLLFVTEESFCDLLEEHLYLVAKEKMEELLPQIQEHIPNAEIFDGNDNHTLCITQPNKVEYIVYFERWGNYRLVANYVDGIDLWKDQPNLIVKKPKPWWEKCEEYFLVSQNIKTGYFYVSKHKSGLNWAHAQIAGKRVFQTKQEAQEMCDKLNDVLEGK